MVDLESLCTDLYTDTRQFYPVVRAECEDLGYQILMGPPRAKPSLLFIGFQPGGSHKPGKNLKSALQEREYGSEERWPPQSEYLTETWRLATILRDMFGTTLLEDCVGMNAIFFRSPNVAEYSKVPRQTREAIADFCLPRVRKIAGAMEPKLIVAIGLGTLGLFDKDASPITSLNSARVIAKRGNIDGLPAIGTLHLSGAHISNSDRAQIRDCVLNTIGRAN
jgi:hypothetical protein